MKTEEVNQKSKEFFLGLKRLKEYKTVKKYFKIKKETQSK